AQHVVVPPRRECKGGPRGAALAISLDPFAGRSPAQEAPLEKVLLPPEASRSHFRTARDGALVFEQRLEHADGGVEGGTRRAVRGFAVPAAVGQLLRQQPVDDAADVLPEIRA